MEVVKNFRNKKEYKTLFEVYDKLCEEAGLEGELEYFNSITEFF